MSRGTVRFIEYLVPTASLATEPNPWNYSSLDLTLVYELYGRSRSIESTAKEYFSCGLTASLYNALYHIRRVCESRIKRGLEPNHNQEHPRVVAVWTQALGSAKPAAQIWGALMIQEPHISAADWSVIVREELDRQRKQRITWQAEDERLKEKARHDREEKVRKAREQEETRRAERERRTALGRQFYKTTPDLSTTVKESADRHHQNLSVSEPKTKTQLPRTCPRCRGSMIPERDWYGEYATCLTCGYVHEAVSSPPIDLLEEEENGRRQRRRQPSHGKIKL